MTLWQLHFIRPYWLLALLPATALLVQMYRYRLKQGGWAKFCDEALLPFLLQQQSATNRLPLFIGAVVAVLAIIAMAGPSWERLPTPVFRNASALVIALDLSASMDAEDIKPSRLIRARYKIADLLKQRKDGQTALLVFAGEAYVVTPLTNDSATIDSQLSALTTDIMPNPGNNAATAIAIAVDLLKQAGFPQGQILLVSDGVDVSTAKGSLPVLAGRYSLAVLGVGTEQGAPIATTDGGFLKDQQGNILVPKLDAEGLAALANAGGGIYQTITTTDADIQRLAAFSHQSMQQENQANANLMLDLWDDKGPWFLLAVLPLAALAFRKGLLGLVLLSLAWMPDSSYAFEWKDLWLRKDQRGQQAFQRREFAKAASEFDNPEWKGSAFYHAGDYQKALENFSASQQPENSSHHYNRGNALAKSGQFQEAIKAYEKALELNPKNEDARFNKELIEKELEKQKQEQQKQQDQQNQEQKSEQDQDKQQQENTHQSKQGDQQDQSNQADNAEKPEQKPERPERKESDDRKQDSSATDQQQQEETEPKQEKEVNQRNPKEQPNQTKQSTEPGQLTEEQQQANEQWLKRIPDDPSGLLRRKFKYQYGQQKR